MQRTIETSLALILMLSATVASGQAPTAEGLVSITEPWLLESWGFAPDAAGGRFCNAGFPFFEGVFEGLPHGPRLTAFQFWTFDSSTETILGLALRTCNQDFAAPTMTVLGVFTSFGSGGYDSGIVSPDSDVDDIDGQCTYSIQYRLDDGSTLCSEGNELRLVGAQARWIRHVSPAPDTATFDDVPTTHLFFQHIESLVPAGVTAAATRTASAPTIG